MNIDRFDDNLALSPITPDQATAVRLHIAAHAHDGDDARELLAALGLGGDA